MQQHVHAHLRPTAFCQSCRDRDEAVIPTSGTRVRLRSSTSIGRQYYDEGLAVQLGMLCCGR